MATKKGISKAGSDDDYLGLLAFGSFISNIFQIASKKQLEGQHQNLKTYAINLKQHYDAMIERYKQLSGTYLSMKKVHSALWEETKTLNDVIAMLRMENNKLIKERDALIEENIKLKDSKVEASKGRKRRVVKREIDA